MQKNWYMLQKKYRPVIEDLSRGEQYTLDVETDDEIYFTDDGKQIYYYKNEENTAFIYIKQGADFLDEMSPTGVNVETALKCVGDGWGGLVKNLYIAKPKNVYVAQVKEKWGTLHFYVASAPEWYLDLIDFYEEKSSKICEICGGTGRIRSDLGWIMTLCDNHYNQSKNQTNA